MTELNLRERAARAIHEGLGESWAYSNYSGNEWVACRDMLDSAADSVIAVITPGWQPIETAPKDGTLVLLHRPGWLNNRLAARWQTDFGKWDINGHLAEPEWFDS